MTTNECACLYVHRIIVPANVLLDVTVSSTAEAYAQFPELPIEILRQRTLGGGLIEFSLGTGALGVPGGSEGTSAIACINIP